MQILKNIAITMGDPGGVGPEIIVKALFCAEIREYCNPVVIGSEAVLSEAVKVTGLPLKIRRISGISGARPETGTIQVLDIKSPSPFKKNVPSQSAGKVIVKYIEKAVGLAMKKEVDAIVTAPISKESLRMAGHTWPGHTELLAELTNAGKFAMMFVSDKLKVILCTIHIPLKDVPASINTSLVFETIQLAEKGAKMLGMDSPRIAVAGLNPHAGESGIMGQEEMKSIVPAVQRAQSEGLSVSGPYPPDVIFHKAYNGVFDIIVCMYHDQGLIPFKMLAFDTGVNVTVGLPVIRTSPDHGTAFDIAWKNMASPSSMLEAIRLASIIKL